MRLIVDGERAVTVRLPASVKFVAGEDVRGYYPSVPGSLLAQVDYAPKRQLRPSITKLRPALEGAVRLAARRRTGQGIRQGHRQELVREISRIIGRRLPSPTATPSRKDDGATQMEGALRRVTSSRYERNAAARRDCINEHGLSCFVCEFSFEEEFGEIGRGFIHVHHLVPVSQIGKRYKVDGRRDLRPVCPNCHAMLHRMEPPMEIREARRLRAPSRPARK